MATQSMTGGLIDRADDELESRQRHSGKPLRVNVGSRERALSFMAGLALSIVGMRRRGLSRLWMAGAGGALLFRGASGHCATYSALHIDTSRAKRHAREAHAQQAFLIQRTPEELYGYWRDFQNLPEILSHVQSVRVIDERRSHWVVDAPRVAGGSIEWDAEITYDEPSSCIAWRSLPGADVESEGEIRFREVPGDRGTEVRVAIDYRPPAGKLGDWIATLSGVGARSQIRDDLRNFKRRMECGEVVTTEGQPHGTCGAVRRFLRG
jgi:uncharacterized membrane protein